MKINKILDGTVKSYKEVDYYVPITIYYRENNEKYQELFYYRAKNKRSSFIEVTISSSTKKIVRIIVVSINDIVETDGSIERITSLLGKTGNPEMDMNLFENEGIITDEIDFKIVRHDKRIYVLYDVEKINKKLIMENCEILLDDDNILGYIFSGFTKEEWIEINESIDSSTKKRRC